MKAKYTGNSAEAIRTVSVRNAALAGSCTAWSNSALR